MRGTGQVVVGRQAIYAHFTLADRQARLRMSADERDQLDLFANLQTTVRLPGRPATSALVKAVFSTSPFVWVEMHLSSGF